MLSGDGQQGAVHVREVREEGGEGVELSRGDVAKVHWVEHHQHVLAEELGQVDLGGEDVGVSMKLMKRTLTFSSLPSRTELRVKSGALLPGRRAMVGHVCSLGWIVLEWIQLHVSSISTYFGKTISLVILVIFVQPAHAYNDLPNSQIHATFVLLLEVLVFVGL